MKAFSLTLLGGAAALAPYSRPIFAAGYLQRQRQLLEGKSDYPPTARLQVSGDDWLMDRTSIGGGRRPRPRLIGVKVFG